MKLTDQDIAEALDKEVEEIEDLKKENPALYEILFYGVLCQKLSLSEEDLEKYRKMVEKEVEE